METINSTAVSNTSMGLMLFYVKLFDFNPAELVVISLLRYVISVAGITANVLIIRAIRLNQHFHTAGYVLMANLAVAEIVCSFMFCVLACSLSLYWFSNQEGIDLDRWNNDSMTYLGVVFIYGYNLSVFLLLAISINRCYSVLFYYKYSTVFTLRRTVIGCVIFHICALLLNVLQLPGVNLANYQYYPMLWNFQVEFNPARSPYVNEIFFSYQVVAYSTILVITACYLLVFRKLRQIKQIRQHQQQQKQEQKPDIAQAQNKGGSPKREDVLLSIQYAIVTGVFVVMWIFTTTQMYVIDGVSRRVIAAGGRVSREDSMLAKGVMGTVLVMAAVNFNINPLVYCLINTRLREAMLRQVGPCAGRLVQVMRETSSATGNSKPNTSVTSL